MGIQQVHARSLYSFLGCITFMVVYLFVIKSVCAPPCRQIKANCAESFTEYWTCLDYSNLLELRRCRQQQKAFDSCVLDKLGWERPDLGDLSKVRRENHWALTACIVVYIPADWTLIRSVSKSPSANHLCVVFFSYIYLMLLQACSL